VRPRWRWLLPLAAVPVLALLAYGFTLNPRDVPSPLVGRPAAPFALTSFDGAPVDLAALRGKVVVLNFWASWCYPACYEEAPALERGWRAYRDRGVVVVGVDIQDKDEAARTFIGDFSLTFANAPDRTGKVSIDYGVYGVPETYVIDQAGTIRYKQIGPISVEVLHGTILPLVRELQGAKPAIAGREPQP
jgi:cytochrome c biogenesis protein CcmG, thiol:disulfide interchange protein DsbE